MSARRFLFLATAPLWVVPVFLWLKWRIAQANRLHRSLVVRRDALRMKLNALEQWSTYGLN